MLKGKKLLLFAAGALVLGLMFGGAAIAFGALNAQTWQEANAKVRVSQGFNETPVQKTVAVSQTEFDEFVLKSDGGQTELLYNTDPSQQQIIINYFEDFPDQKVVSTDDTSLYIALENKPIVFWIPTFNTVSYKMTVLLPQGFEIKNNAAITINGGSFLAKDIELPALSLNINGGTAVLQNIKTTNAQQKSKLQINGGTMTVKSCDFNDVSNIKASGGKVMLEDGKTGSIDLVLASGGTITTYNTTLGAIQKVSVSGGTVNLQASSISSIKEIIISGGKCYAQNIIDAVDLYSKSSGGDITVKNAVLSEATVVISGGKQIFQDCAFVSLDTKISGGRLELYSGAISQKLSGTISGGTLISENISAPLYWFTISGGKMQIFGLEYKHDKINFELKSNGGTVRLNDKKDIPKENHHAECKFVLTLSGGTVDVHTK